MIGNDIISLSSLPSYTAERRDRYARKILTDREYSFWIEHGSTAIDLFKYWGLKEASYKVWNRQSQKRLFNPKWFSTERPLDDNEVTVKTPVGNYQGRVNIHQEYIYAEVVGNESVALEKVQSIIQVRGGDCFVNSCLMKENGMPYYQVLGEKIPISISHCGTWEAVAFIRLAKIDRSRMNIHKPERPLVQIV